MPDGVLEQAKWSVASQPRPIENLDKKDPTKVIFSSAMTFRAHTKAKNAVREILDTVLATAVLELKKNQLEDEFDLDFSEEESKDECKTGGFSEMEEISQSESEETYTKVCCKYCHKVFKHAEAKHHHELFFHEVEQLSPSYSEQRFGHCDFCDRIFSNMTSLKYHVLKVHEKNVTCDAFHGDFSSTEKCQKEFSIFQDYLDHRRSMTGAKELPNTVECKLCGKKFTRTNLKRHRMSAHGLKVKNPFKVEQATAHFDCEECGKKFNRKDNLKRHKDLIHTDTTRERIHCLQCPKTFIWKTHLDKHVQEDHSKFLSTFRCEECNKMFREVKSLKRHKKEQHTNSPKFKCPKCEKFFSQKANQSRHTLKCKKREDGKGK